MPAWRNACCRSAALVACAAVHALHGGQAREGQLLREISLSRITAILSSNFSGDTNSTCPETARSMAASNCKKNSSVASANGLLRRDPKANCAYAVQRAPDVGLDHQQRVAPGR